MFPPSRLSFLSYLSRLDMYHNSYLSFNRVTGLLIPDIAEFRSVVGNGSTF